MAMKTRLRILYGIDLDHAAHFPAVFGRNSGGVDAERLDLVGFNLRSKARRAIVGEGNAVHHELRLILGAAGMEHGVPFIEPARLRVNEVLQGASRNRVEAVLDTGRANLIDIAGLLRI